MKASIAALLAGLALACAVAWALHEDRPPAVYAGTPPAVFPWHLATHTDTAAPSATWPAATAAAVAAPATPVAAELCGLGRVSLPPGTAADAAARGVEALPAPIGQLALEQARQRMLGSLQASGEPRAAVAALMLQRPNAEEPEAWQAWATQVLDTARLRPDPVALAWAEEACGYTADGQRCRLGLIRARIAAEPGNAQHWAALADEDPAAADEAWHGMARATHWHQGPYALVSTALRALPADVPAYLRAALAAELTTRSAALPSPGEGYLQDRCSESAPGRGAQCGALAELLASQGDSPAAMTQALRLGRLVGWPETRVAAMQAQYGRIANAEAEWRTRGDQPLSCNGVEGWLHQFERVATGPR